MLVTQSEREPDIYIPDPEDYIDLEDMHQEDKEKCKEIERKTGYSPLILSWFAYYRLDGFNYEEFSGKLLRDIYSKVRTISNKIQKLKKRYHEEVTKKYREYLKSSLPENIDLSVDNTRYIKKLNELEYDMESLIRKASMLGRNWPIEIYEEVKDYVTPIGPFLVGDCRSIHQLHKVSLFVPKFKEGQSPEEIKENFEKNVECVVERLETKKGEYEKELNSIESELKVVENTVNWFDENLEKFL